MRKLAKERLTDQCTRNSSTQTEEVLITKEIGKVVVVEKHDDVIKEKEPTIIIEEPSCSTKKSVEQLTKRQERRKKIGRAHV